uniref:RUN domain-containing protein n=1 Tax=Trichobilharzia regenti TaxID=157069 RepID=A0AA85IPU4_TRIRE|nr:unnamed protein product [Trichobilharzia regenti]
MSFETAENLYNCYEEDTSLLLEETVRPKERWAPLGANASPEPGHHAFEESGIESNLEQDSELSRLMLENEQLNNSLMALTSHIAQVQFRLGQILNAEAESREPMLKSLEEYASRGIPDLQLLAEHCNKLSLESKACSTNLSGRPQKLIEQLRRHLDDLERFAYETGEQSEPPTQTMLEKQRLVIEGLREKLELNISNLDQLPADKLKQVVDNAVNQFLNPVKVSEKLVEQLKTQVNDLERFIDFLHGSGACSDALAKALADFKRTHQQLSANDKAPCCRHSKSSDMYKTQNGDTVVDDDKDNLSDDSDSPTENLHHGVQLGHSRHIHPDSEYFHTNEEYDNDNFDDIYAEDQYTKEQFKNTKSISRDNKKSRLSIMSLMQRAITILSLFAASHLDQDPDTLFTKLNVNKYSTQKTRKANSATVEKAKAQHWGTIRARLEVAINIVQEKVAALEACRLTKTLSINLYATHHTIPNSIWSNSKATDSHQNIPLGRESPDGKPSIPTRSSNIVRPYASTRKVFSQDEVPGTQIALPVQNLHDASLRAMLHGGRPDRVFSETFSSHEEKAESVSCTEENDDLMDDPYETEFLHTEAERAVVHVVRRLFCTALRDLIEHGLIKKALSQVDENSPLGLVHKSSTFLLRPIINCLDTKNYSEDGFEYLNLNETTNDEISTKNSSKSRSSPFGFHAWDVLMRFYQIKNGPRYNDSPARKLCESFDLHAVGNKKITDRQRFFSAMGTVLQSHMAYKRSKDAKFKAFISIALNEHQLVSWLRMIFRNQAFVQSIYEPWSYAFNTGFSDVLTSLHKLTELKFNLPYDFSIRHLKDIHDAF